MVDESFMNVLVFIVIMGGIIGIEKNCICVEEIMIIFILKCLLEFR